MPRLGEQLLAVASRGVSAKRLAPASGSARWPPWESVASGASRAIFPPGLLSGTEAAIWAAMSAVGHEQLVAPRPGKQAAVRAALKAAGLGWVATNTIPYRIAVGKLFDLARGLALQSGRRAFRPRNATGKRQRDGRDRASPRTALQGDPAPVVPVVVSSVPLPDDAWFDGPLDECFVQQRRTKVMKTLQSSGAAVVRGCCSVNHLRSCHRLLGKHQQLRETAGNGVSASSSESRGSIAGSFYCDLEGYDDVQRLCEELLSPEGFSRRLQPQPKKTIFLSYGLGGENWAHQDNNCCQACPFQALLLLSHPGVDFSGGTFYVARKARGGGIIRHEVALTSPGDLVVFQAGKGSGWFHGILPVRRGTAEDCRREAVGLLQPA